MSLFFRNRTGAAATVTVVTAAILFFGYKARAQQPDRDDSPQPARHASTLTVTTRLVVLDVVVTDKAGNPVTDLKRDEFTVYEDGKAQRVASFESPSAHVLPTELQASADKNAVFDPSQPKAFGQSPVTVLVLDQLNTHFSDSAFGKTSIRDYLLRQPETLAQPTTLLVVYDEHFKVAKQFTRNRDELLKALAAEPPHKSWKLDLFGSAEWGPIERLDQSLRALEQIAQSTARIPGRKNLVWVGGGFPTLDPTTIDGREAAEVKSTIQHVTNTLQDTHVTMYAVDPTSSAAGMAEITDENAAEFVAVVADASAGATATFNNGEDFDNLAPITGGRIVRGLNDVAHQIQLSVDLGGSFYTIGYSPSGASDAAAKYRKIRVDVKRPGLTVKTRDGYFPEQNRQAVSAARETISYDLSTAAESTVALNGLKVTAQAVTSVSAPPVSYAVRVGAAGLTWKPNEDGTSTASVAVMAVWLDKSGKMLGHTLHGMVATARAGANLRDGDKTADFAFTVEPVKKKAATLRFVVRDTATGRMGTFDIRE